MEKNFEGSKYQETKDIYGSPLVKIIKDDIKSQLPKEYKVLAHKELYAGGWTIHFTIKNTGIVKYLTDIGNKHIDNPEYKSLYGKVSDIVEQYNFDNSDMMSDYYSVRFYKHIRIEE